MGLPSGGTVVLYSIQQYAVWPRPHPAGGVGLPSNLTILLPASNLFHHGLSIKTVIQMTSLLQSVLTECIHSVTISRALAAMATSSPSNSSSSFSVPPPLSLSLWH